MKSITFILQSYNDYTIEKTSIIVFFKKLLNKWLCKKKNVVILILVDRPPRKNKYFEKRNPMCKNVWSIFTQKASSEEPIY